MDKIEVTAPHVSVGAPTGAEIMPLDEILKALSIIKPPFPAEAMLAATARRDEIVPALLNALLRVSRNPDEGFDNARSLWLYGLFLSAQFREKKALEPLLALCRLPENKMREVLGDIIAEYLPGLLRSIAGGDMEPVIALLEDETLYRYVRTAAVNVLQAEAEPGSALEADLRVRYHRMLKRAIETAKRAETDQAAKYDDTVATFIGASCAEMGFRDFLPLLKEAYDSRAIDPAWMRWADYEDFLSPDLSAKERRKLRHMHDADVIDDAAALMRGWDCFKFGFEDNGKAGESLLPWEKEASRPRSMADGVAAPDGASARKGKKVGPNQPCPCGSGKKHKKCCGR